MNVALTVGAALMYRDCGERDRKGIRAVGEAIPDPCPNVVMVPEELYVRVRPKPGERWEALLTHVFETSWNGSRRRRRREQSGSAGTGPVQTLVGSSRRARARFASTILDLIDLGRSLRRVRAPESL